ncbi:outer membrane beta-barrel protein [Pseudoalteromonas sp. SSM20]|uniref:outer membrane beta-barrel protein n=1 Tax=Pseudoalteromonas sp. SSM20 TaxID=3139394 RepID=UPI003BA89CA5
MNKRLLSVSILAMAAISTTAYSEPGVITTESGFVVTPLLDLGLTYDDNIYSNSEEVSSSILNIDPSVNFLLDDGVNKYSIDVGMLSGLYSENSSDNFFDGLIGLGMHMEPSSKTRFNLGLDANWTSEPRGTGLTEGEGDINTKMHRYAEQRLSGDFEYGSKTAFGRIGAMAEYYNKDYLNFKSQSQYRNYESMMLGGKFIYNTQAGTDAFLEVSNTDINYDVRDPNEYSRDSYDIDVLLGFEWEATALTTGKAKVGYQKKDFISSGRETYSGFIWELGVTWQPLSYTKVNLNTYKGAEETLTDGDFINTTSLEVEWQHGWSEDLSSALSIGYSDFNYEGIIRTDDELKFKAAIDYQILRWISLRLFAEVLDKNSTDKEIEFDKNIIGISSRISL